MRQVVIAGRTIGPDSPPFIVGEAGINHNGSIDRALAMVTAAKEAGCDAIKFATLRASEFCNPAHMISYMFCGTLITEPEVEMFGRSELRPDEWRTIKAECDRHGIIFFSTPQNVSDLNLLLSVGVPAIKIGSDDLTNLALIEAYASHGLPIILSTGMADAWDVRMAVHTAERVPVVLCVCTSEYPCPPEHANISRLATLKQVMPDIPLGFSDHTIGPQAATVAAALGACYFEKHFTMDNDLRGPDHAFSANPLQLSNWVWAIKNSRMLLGSGEIEPTEVERVNREKWRRASGQQIRGSA